MSTTTVLMPENSKAGKDEAPSLYETFSEERRAKVREFLLEKADELSLYLSTLANLLELRDDGAALHAVRQIAIYAAALEKAAVFLKKEVKAAAQPA